MASEITIHDDGKERHHSFTASVTLSTVAFSGFATLEVCGYGADEEEARASLSEQLRSMIVAVGMLPAI